MNGTVDRASWQSKGHLAFSGNGWTMCVEDDRRAGQRLVVIRPIVAEKTERGNIVVRYAALGEDLRSGIAGIGLMRTWHEAHDAHAAEQLQDDEASHETAEYAIHGSCPIQKVVGDGKNLSSRSNNIDGAVFIYYKIM